MKKLRVLIVEDEALVAMDLENTIIAVVPAEVTVVASVSNARTALTELFDIAFLDIDVTDGKTYDVARLLMDKQIRCVFVSASLQDDLPGDLRHILFVPKPFRQAQIEYIFLADTPESAPEQAISQLGPE